MHNLQEIKCTFLIFFWDSTRELGAAAKEAINEQLYWLCPASPVLRPGKKQGRNNFLPGTAHDPLAYAAQSSPIPNNCTGYTPRRQPLPRAQAAQFPNNYTGTGVPITPKPR